MAKFTATSGKIMVPLRRLYYPGSSAELRGFPTTAPCTDFLDCLRSVARLGLDRALTVGSGCVGDLDRAEPPSATLLPGGTGRWVSRWITADMLNAARWFRPGKGYKQMAQFLAALYRYVHVELKTNTETAGAGHLEFAADRHSKRGAARETSLALTQEVRLDGGEFTLVFPSSVESRSGRRAANVNAQCGDGQIQVAHLPTLTNAWESTRCGKLFRWCQS